jgi:glycosyltransferase involved in cell wall biosynthesis
LFVASIHRTDSPNLDALFWYMQEILPVLKSRMPEPPILNFAGFVAPGIDLGAFAGHPHIRIHGPAISLRVHYEQNRLFIAPTRFAAGTPYKLYEAASFGLPCVATELLARQLDWQDGVDLLVAPVNDPQRFATQIAQLYRSPDLWATLRENALDRIVRENTPEAFNTKVNAILDAACRAGGGAKGSDKAKLCWNGSEGNARRFAGSNGGRCPPYGSPDFAMPQT